MPKKTLEQRIVALLKKQKLIPEGKPDGQLLAGLKAIFKPSVPSVRFTDVNGGHLTKEFGLNMTNVTNESIPRWMLPDDVKQIVPRLACEDMLACVARNFVLTSEATRRTLIDLTLADVLDNEEFQSSIPLRCWGEVPMHWRGANVGFHGKADYAIGHGLPDAPPTLDTYLIAIEAKVDWPKTSIYQALAQGATLHKKRKAAGKKAIVFVILSNGLLWQFFNIGEDGYVQASDLIYLSVANHPHAAKGRQEVFTWVGHLMRQARLISPTTSLADVATATVNHVDDDDDHHDDNEDDDDDDEDDASVEYSDWEEENMCI
ncbi:hypothetical protein SpCBS45565_g00301 [Spizellomyces sp. 'palustris']|nr:hypothetical protein SpCBS45565_g00301 [Spizellomyces sp. 'palustris']